MELAGNRETPASFTLSDRGFIFKINYKWNFENIAGFPAARLLLWEGACMDKTRQYLIDLAEGKPLNGVTAKDINPKYRSLAEALERVGQDSRKGILDEAAAEDPDLMTLLSEKGVTEFEGIPIARLDAMDEGSVSLATVNPDDIKPTEYLCDGLLPRGSLFLIYGAAKKSGKTSFMLSLFSAICRGVPFMGRQTQQTGVFMLIEQNKDQFLAEYAKPSGIVGVEGFDFQYRAANNDISEAEWDAVLAYGTRKCLSMSAGVLAIDTFISWSGVEDENDNARIAKLLRRAGYFQAKYGLSICIVHHANKMGGSRGASTFEGMVDVICGYGQTGGDPGSTVRKAQFLSRYTGIPHEITMERRGDPGQWRYAATTGIISMTARLREVLPEIIGTGKGSGTTTAEVEKAMAEHKVTLTTNKVRDELNDQVEQGLMHKFQAPGSNAWRYYYE